MVLKSVVHTEDERRHRQLEFGALLPEARIDAEVDVVVVGQDEDVAEAIRSHSRDADLVLLPGSKSTVGDLAFFRKQGWDIDLSAHVRRGGYVIGICGGYQMLGKTISDPDGIEGASGTVEGLGYLDVETVLTPEKSLVEATGKHLPSGAHVSGYEIHIGRTKGPDCARPFLHIRDASGRPKLDGAQSADGRIAGTYLHGLLTDDDFRKAYLKGFGAASTLAYDQSIDGILDELANHLGAVMDADALLDIAQKR